MRVKVSVILPVYNGGEYIRECLDSLVNQTYSDYEIIVIDDCSTDDTEQVIHTYVDERIRYYKNSENRGIVFSLNRAISLSKGEYIARMDADDICMPNRLERQVAYLDQFAHVGLVSAWFGLFGGLEGTVKYETVPEKIKCCLLFSLQLLHPGWMFRRELVEKHNLYYREEYKYAEDWDFLVRAATVTQLSNVSEVLMRYRINPGQITNVFSAEQKRIADNVARNQLHALNLSLTDEEFRLYRNCFGRREILMSVPEMESLIAILVRLEEANLKVGTYQSDVLHAVIQEELYYLAYYNLIHGRKSGLVLKSSSFYKGLRIGTIRRLKLWLRSVWVRWGNNKSTKTE